MLCGTVATVDRYSFKKRTPNRATRNLHLILTQSVRIHWSIRVYGHKVTNAVQKCEPELAFEKVRVCESLTKSAGSYFLLSTTRIEGFVLVTMRVVRACRQKRVDKKKAA